MKKLLLIIVILWGATLSAQNQLYASRKVSRVTGTELTVQKINLTFAEATKGLIKTNALYQGMSVYESKSGTLYAIKETPEGVIKKRLPKKQ